MKRLLLSTAFALGFAGVAHAQLPVTDAGSIAQLVHQVQTSLQQLQTLQSQLTQLQSIYSTVSGMRNLDGVLSATSQLGLTNNMPINPFAVQSLMNGNGSITGMTGSIGSLFNSNWAANNTYSCTGNSPECLALQQRANAIAGQQGLAGELYQEVGNHITILQGLQAQLSGSKDLQTTSYINGQIAAQQSAIGDLTAQTQSLAVMQNAAVQAQQLQAEQRRQQQIDQVLAADPDQP